MLCPQIEWNWGQPLIIWISVKSSNIRLQIWFVGLIWLYKGFRVSKMLFGFEIISILLKHPCHPGFGKLAIEHRNKLKHIHLLVIKLEHLNFGFETNGHWTSNLKGLKGRTFQELDKQTMSSANFQAENFLSGLVFDGSTFLLSLRIDQNSRFVYRTLEKCGL